MAKIYISSTGQDLVEYRTAASQVCREFGHVVMMLEYFALPVDPLERLLAEVDIADIYLLIVGLQYGFVPISARNPEKLSITHLEYRQARASGKLCLIFTIGELASWLQTFVEFSKELHESTVFKIKSVEDFRDKLSTALRALPRGSKPVPEIASFDAFLSYTSSDSQRVQAIASRLIHDGVSVWMDVSSLRPGDKWSELTDAALLWATTVVVFVGSNVGPGQQAEIDRTVLRSGIRIIPVLLPGTDSKSVPLPLRQFKWIAFSSPDDPIAYNALLSALHPTTTPAAVSLTDADLQLLADTLFRVVVRLRERHEMLSSLDGATFWAQVRKIAPQVSTLEDLRNLKQELSSIPGPGPLWSAWICMTRASELATLMRNAPMSEAKPS